MFPPYASTPYSTCLTLVATGKCNCSSHGMHCDCDNCLWICRVVISTSHQWGAEITKLDVPPEWKGTRLRLCKRVLLYPMFTKMRPHFHSPEYYCSVANLAGTAKPLRVICRPFLPVLQARKTQLVALTIGPSWASAWMLSADDNNSVALTSFPHSNHHHSFLNSVTSSNPDATVSQSFVPGLFHTVP